MYVLRGTQYTFRFLPNLPSVVTLVQVTVACYCQRPRTTTHSFQPGKAKEIYIHNDGYIIHTSNHMDQRKQGVPRVRKIVFARRSETYR
jgi:hypothetical protein